MNFVERSFELPGIGQRTYRFPTHFREVELMIAPLLVPLSVAQHWVPKDISPIALPGARALALFSVQYFGNPAQLEPYGEASFAVLARTGRLKGFHVLTMPVTSAENRARGLTIFGLPKELAEVSFSGDERTREGVVRVGGELLFSLQFRRHIALPGTQPIRAANLQHAQGRWSRVRSAGRARYTVGSAVVEIGDALRRRFPGLPERARSFLAARISDAEILLHLPE
jgi:hypothetical protein